MDFAVSHSALSAARASDQPPLVIDVRREPVFLDAATIIKGALRRDPARVSEWAGELPDDASIVVYCVHGHEVSQRTAQALRDHGLNARFLDHGIEGWSSAGGALQVKPARSATCWVTRERPKIDRIACPWIVRRFIDRDAEFLYVPATEVGVVATALAAVPYDIVGAEYGHAGDECSFDAFVRHHALGGDAALCRLATIVRGADTGNPALAPESPGLLAFSTGLSRLYTDDSAMLAQGMHIYDALYRWCQDDQPAGTTWRLPAQP